MKLVIASLTVLALAAAIVGAGSCSITPRSSEFECAKQSDCKMGRQCSGGLCVLIDDLPDGCPEQCTSCDLEAKQCTIDCEVEECNAAVTCPPGFDCEVLCTTDNSCRAGVLCATATSCTVRCAGQGACRGVQCGSAPCDVECSGRDACRNVFCNTSCACDVSCGDQSLCENVVCGMPLCGTIDGGCTSDDFCDRCR